MVKQAIAIMPMERRDEAEWSASLMSGSEPWLTLGRTYQDALKILTDADNERYIARVDDERSGFVVIVMKGTFTGYIKSLAVAPAYRNRGLGHRLIAFAEERIFTEQPNVFICVSTFNPRAKRLYERMGYKVIGLLEDYIVPGHGEYLLRKSIAPMSEFTPLPGGAVETRSENA
jgi:ribosomal-protein-alanine N-acetyltransferase